MQTAPTTPSATAIRARIEAGSGTATDALETCIRHVETHEAEIRALAWFDAAAARDKAAASDARGNAGLLGGVPIGVKDVIDTADMPTEYGSPLYRGHRPAKDAAVVTALRAEGALVVAKTTTVEFASLGRIPPTTNPHARGHTPGGSSGGSAAAVAAGMVPVALATQTGGSTIRPASFCGVAALKPTFGTVPVEGMRPYAPSLDTLGWIARSVDDLALVARALRISLDADTCATPLRIGFYRTPYWRHADDDCRRALDVARRALADAGIGVVDVAVPDDAERLNAAQDVIMHGEGRVAFLAEYLRDPEALHPEQRAEVENTRGYDGRALREAYDYLARRREQFDAALEPFDAWLTPAVPGEAPAGLAATGEAVFNRLWTALHVPALTVPCTLGQRGLPVGVQLVARRFGDASLLAVARHVEQAIAALHGV